MIAQCMRNVFTLESRIIGGVGILGGGGGLDIVIIFSNRGGWNNTGDWTGLKK